MTLALFLMIYFAVAIFAFSLALYTELKVRGFVTYDEIIGFIGLSITPILNLVLIYASFDHLWENSKFAGKVAIDFRKKPKSKE